MSVINNVLKDLESRASQFTPIEIDAIGVKPAPARDLKPLLLVASTFGEDIKKVSGLDIFELETSEQEDPEAVNNAPYQGSHPEAEERAMQQKRQTAQL